MDNTDNFLDVVHFIKVEGRDVLPAAEFDDVEDYLRQDWIFTRRRELLSEEMEIHDECLREAASAQASG